jgi:S1-C subfamily serine protease
VRWKAGFLLALLGLGAAGCGATRPPAQRAGQAHYQTAYPAHDTSDELREVFRSVKRIAMTADYVTYLFPLDEEVTEARLGDPAFLARAVDTLPSSHSRTGTAVILSGAEGRLTLLTSHQVVDFPERRLQYRLGQSPGGEPVTEIAGVSIRLQANGQLLDHLDIGPFQVLAGDPERDLALLGADLRPWSEPANFLPLPVPRGESRRLSWGSFVYVFGYPRGYPMVTRAIVSDPDRDLQGGFLMDALWNEGISGGPILALRGESGEFEWVGVARSGVALRELRVEPPGVEALFGEDPELVMLYQGPLAVQQVARIQYGLTIPVAMTTIADFLSRSRDAVRGRGYPVPQ